MHFHETTEADVPAPCTPGDPVPQVPSKPSDPRAALRARAAQLLLAVGLASCVSVTSAALGPAAVRWVGEAFARKAEPPPLPPKVQPHWGTGWPTDGLSRPTRMPWDDLGTAGGTAIDSVFTHPSQSEPGRRALLGELSSYFRVAPRITRATVDAKRFGESFRTGAKDGELRLQKVTGALGTITRPWLGAPRHKRIFVVGVSQNNPDAKRLKRGLAADGYQVFFYKFCEPVVGVLCSTEDVGAFFGSAGHVVAFKTPDLLDSQYVHVELASIRQHTAGGLLLVFTPEHVQRAGRSSSVAFLTAAAYDLNGGDRRTSVTVPAAPAPPRLPR